MFRLSACSALEGLQLIQVNNRSVSPAAVHALGSDGYITGPRERICVMPSYDGLHFYLSQEVLVRGEQGWRQDQRVLLRPMTSDNMIVVSGPGDDVQEWSAPAGQLVAEVVEAEAGPSGTGSEGGADVQPVASLRHCPSQRVCPAPAAHGADWMDACCIERNLIRTEVSLAKKFEADLRCDSKG